MHETAARALESMMWGAVDALPPLEQALRDERVAVRRDAARLMATIGPEAFDAIGALRAARRDADRGRRSRRPRTFAAR